MTFQLLTIPITLPLMLKIMIKVNQKTEEAPSDDREPSIIS